VKGVQGSANEMDDGVQLHSAWSQQHLVSRADNVLVETLPVLSVAKHQQEEGRDDINVLEQGAAELTSDAFKVAIYRVSKDEVPLSPAAIRAAEVITLDILNRAKHDKLDIEPSCQESKCGPDHIKLASVIVHRVLASSNHTKWSNEAVQAASLLVEDVLLSTLTCVSRGGDGAKPDHMWSREAIQISCLIVRDLMADAAGQSSMGKHSAGLKQPTQSQSKDLVNHIFVADQGDVIELVAPQTADLLADSSLNGELREDEPLSIGQPPMQLLPAQSQSQDLVNPIFDEDQCDVEPLPSSQVTAALPADSTMKSELKPDEDIIERPLPAPQPTATPPTFEVASACECCYDQDSVFGDSSDLSQ